MNTSLLPPRRGVARICGLAVEWAVKALSLPLYLHNRLADPTESVRSRQGKPFPSYFTNGFPELLCFCVVKVPSAIIILPTPLGFPRGLSWGPHPWGICSQPSAPSSGRVLSNSFWSRWWTWHPREILGPKVPQRAQVFPAAVNNGQDLRCHLSSLQCTVFTDQEVQVLPSET